MIVAVTRMHSCGAEWLATDARSYATCPQCGATGLGEGKRRPSPAVIVRGRSETASWSHRGLWGDVRSAESPALAEMRQRLEAGTFARGADRTRAMTLSRSYELARRMGMEPDARQIDANMARVNAEGFGFMEPKRRRDNLPTGVKREAYSVRNRRGGIDRHVRLST